MSAIGFIFGLGFSGACFPENFYDDFGAGAAAERPAEAGAEAEELPAEEFEHCGGVFVGGS